MTYLSLHSMGATESKNALSPDSPQTAEYEGYPQPNADGITDYSQLLYDRSFVGAPDYIAFTIDNFMSAEECQELIQISEDHGYEAAQINIGGGAQILVTDVRSSDRSIIDDPQMGERFWERLHPHVPSEYKAMVANGLNERMRFLRYDKGGYFKPHFDGSYERPDGSERSYITFFLYLNEGYQGGQSTFIHPRMRYNMDKEILPKDRLPIEPATGRLLVFQHNIFHEGSILEAGRKYALRTDVMYTYRKGSGLNYESEQLDAGTLYSWESEGRSRITAKKH